MRISSLLILLGVLGCVGAVAEPGMDPETRAIDDPEDVAEPPLSWVCLNPDTRRYEALKAASLQLAQQAVNGDSTTSCRNVPAALDPERVAWELNTRE